MLPKITVDIDAGYPSIGSNSACVVFNTSTEIIVGQGDKRLYGGHTDSSKRVGVRAMIPRSQSVFFWLRWSRLHPEPWPEHVYDLTFLTAACVTAGPLLRRSADHP